MNFNDVLKSIRKEYMVRKVVEFKDIALKIELEPLISADELKIMEYCKNFEGVQYMEALKIASISSSIKKMNDIDLSGDSVEYEADNGLKKNKSKFLYMTEYLREWPSIILETLFEAFSDMAKESEQKALKNANFERFTMTEKFNEIETKLKEVEEKEEELTEMEQLDKKVEKEISEENSKLS